MELLLALSEDSQRVKVTCDGSESHDFSLLSLVPDADRDTAPPHPMVDPQAYGQAVFAALFANGTSARQHYDGLMLGDRLLLVAQGETLQAIPFEYAHDGSDYLVQDYHFVRGLPENKRRDVPSIDAGLHLMAVPSEPLDDRIAPLNVEGEWQRLEQIVTNELEREVTLERVRPPTLDRLGNLVTGVTGRVIHFMGHGANTPVGSGLLYETNDGAPELVSAKDFVRAVRRAAFLVTLNACVSASPGETELDNIAAGLVANGVPYALGMRFVIADEDALLFSRKFYEQLARGAEVEEALMQARAALMGSRNPWAAGVPVLYTSLKNPTGPFQAGEGDGSVIDRRPPMEVLAIPRAEGVFQGRGSELRNLGGMLTGDARPRVVTIQGGGGQGKTALVREAVERFAWDSPGGVFAYSFEAIPERRTYVADLARFLGIDISQTRDESVIESAVVQQLNSRRTILVLDNLETLLQAVRDDDDPDMQARARHLAAFFRETLNGSRAQLLVTSREFTDWPGERVLPLPGLSDQEGAQLFRENASGRVTDIVMSQVRDLSKLVGGHPLSLKLLGSAFNTTQQPLTAFIADYEQRLRTARDTYKPDDHRHSSLHAAIDTSARHLDDDLRDLLSGLWLFHAPFLTETAVAIFDPDSEYPEGQQSPMYDRLYTLQKRGFLTRETHTIMEGTFQFYRVLPGVRLYAQDMTQTLPRETLLERYGIAYTALANILSNERGRGTLTARWFPLLRADLEHALDHVSDARKTPLLQDLGLITDALGDNQKALDYYQQALPLMRAVGDRSGEAATLNNIGMVYSALGDNQKALDYYQQALPIFTQIGAAPFEAGQCANIAGLYAQLGDRDAAIGYLERAIRVAKARNLPYVAGGMSVEQLRTILQNWRSGSNPAQQTLSAESRNALVGNTVAVLTTVSEKRDQWRTQLEQSLTEAQSKGDSWRIEAEYYTALLALLDGETPTLPDGNPYASDLAQIQAAVTAGGLPQTIPQETRDQIIQNTITALTSEAEQRDTWRQALQNALSNIQDQGAEWQIEIEYHQGLLALLDGETPTLPDGNPYASDLAQIQAAVTAGGISTLEAASAPQSTTETDESDISQQAQVFAGAVQALLNADSLDAMQQVIEQQQDALFSPIAEQGFGAIIQQFDQDGQEQVADALRSMHQIVQTSKVRGIAATFDALRANQANPDDDEKSDGGEA